MVVAFWICVGMVVCGSISFVIDKVEDARFEREWHKREKTIIHNHFLSEMARVRYGNRD